MGLKERQRRKLIGGARPHMEPDEEVRFAVAGQTGSRAGFLGGMNALVGRAKPRVVVGTDRNLYVLRGSMGSTTGVKGVEVKLPLSSALIAYDERRAALTLEHETVWLGIYTDEDESALSELSTAGAAEVLGRAEQQEDEQGPSDGG